MATDPNKLQPIIVKKVKKGGHGVHGGAWKIAYADFVTAMMAFFLLMWLLGSTTEGDKKGLADYFSQPLRVSVMGGKGSGETSNVIQGGGKDLRSQVGQVATVPRIDSTNPIEKKAALDAVKAEIAKQEAKKLDSLSEKISALIASNPKLSEFSSQIRIDVTPDGLQIQIVDDQRRPMFDSGSAVVKPYMREILREINGALLGVDNKIGLDGHTDRKPFGSGERGYSNWELSADRANASRRELLAAGLPDERLGRVMGLASSNLLEEDAPFGAINRRISILVMSREAEARLKGAALPPSSGKAGPAKP
ncbi:MAG: flagellar motor protein MotB [Burkholderiales bacterium]|nr:flagellar motor protein MotB [Burkholderiales bacterium]